MTEEDCQKRLLKLQSNTQLCSSVTSLDGRNINQERMIIAHQKFSLKKVSFFKFPLSIIDHGVKKETCYLAAFKPAKY